MSRRGVLGGLVAVGVGVVGAACGEPEVVRVERPVLPSEGRTVTAAAMEVSERAPSGDGGVPPAGAEYPVSVALPTFGGSNVGVEQILISARSGVRAETRSRYRYSDEPMASTLGYGWSYTELLDDGSGAARADLVALERWDLEHLVANGMLSPLDDWLVSDGSFDPNDYWPGILEAGQIDGVQYALPVAAAPWATVVNQTLAATAGFDVPPREAWDGEAFVRGAVAMHRTPGVAGPRATVGVGLNVEPLWMAPDQLWNDAPSFVFLQSKLGALPDGEGSFEGLRSADAKSVLATFHELATGYGISADQRRRNVDAYDLIDDGLIGLTPLAVSGRWFGNLIGNSVPSENVLYPFPDFGSGRAPAMVWLMLGMGSGRNDPRVIYDALRALERHAQAPTNVPARRVSAETLQQGFPWYRDDEARMVVELMERAAYVRLSRAAWGAFIKEVDAAIILDEVSAEEALDGVRRQLEEMGGGAAQPLLLARRGGRAAFAG
ncbi:MAG: extracellular solute-binding protein [Chloroflexota bacterium]|nr:extracellular solute-binding protein [Chloroflexota bacterium]